MAKGRVAPKPGGEFQRCSGGHLKIVTVINSVNRCPVVVVPPEEVARFEMAVSVPVE
jgi:hypothetical protein